MNTEAKIHADIEALRQNISDTQELYREVCTILFFRYGVTPTANKLYQYVRKGSMSAPAEALAKFWEDLREKSRVRIEHPDLPDVLKSAAGELVATLWSQAQGAAQEGLAVFRGEAQAIVLEARAAQTSIENERLRAISERDQARQASQVAVDRTLELERALAVERASKVGLADQLTAALNHQKTLEAALSEARRDFAAELEKLRQALQRSEERCEAAEKRALLDIDRERTTSAKLQKELIQTRQYQQEVDERYRVEAAQLQADLGNIRQKLGGAEGILQEMRATSLRQAEELYLLRSALSACESQKNLQDRDLMAYREKALSLETELQELRSAKTAKSEAPKPRRQGKKQAAT